MTHTPKASVPWEDSMGQWVWSTINICFFLKAPIWNVTMTYLVHQSPLWAMRACTDSLYLGVDYFQSEIISLILCFLTSMLETNHPYLPTNPSPTCQVGLAFPWAWPLLGSPLTLQNHMCANLSDWQQWRLISHSGYMSITGCYGCALWWIHSRTQASG